MLDANICIYLLDNKSERAADRVEKCMLGELVTSAVSYAEVMIGAERAGGLEQARSFFDQILPLPFGINAANLYAEMPFKRSNFDRLIAAHALSLDLTLVTNNGTDFLDVPGLKVENWTIA